MSRPSPQVHRSTGGYSQQQQYRSAQQHPQHYPPRRLDDGTEPSYLTPPGPCNRLLLALLSPFREEIAWSLSRLIHASNFHPHHLILSEWCGLADRLISFVDRFNKAARGRPGWETDEEESVLRQYDHFEDEDDEEGDEESQGAVVLAQQPTVFDPRRNPSHYFILNAAVSASLILRNCSETSSNAEWISKLHDVARVAYEIIALPEDLFGFEDGTDLKEGGEVEEQMRLEGVREMRLYWAEIAQTLAPRIRVYHRAELARFADGSVKRMPGAMIAASSGTIDDTEASPRHLHSSDRLYAHMVLLLHTTSDRALLLASLRFLAILISASSKTKQEIFVERAVDVDTGGMSPGIVSRCKELLPLYDLDEQLAETLMDCLAATVDVVVEKPNPKASKASDQAAAGVLGLEVDDEEPELRREWPNALKLISPGDSSSSRAQLPSQPTATILSRMLGINTTSWDRTTKLQPHPHQQHVLRYIPNRATHEREIVARADRTNADAKARWRRLREMKAEGGLVEYTTASEKMALAKMKEPDRVQEWLKMVTKLVPNPPAETGAYITQMQIWTSYRDTFEPLVNGSQRSGGEPLPPLMAAADVISSVTAYLPGTQAILRPEEDVRVGGQKFIISGLEGNLRPEVRRYNCQWRGCPQPATDTREGQGSHIDAHVRHAVGAGQGREGCRWATCDYKLPGGRVERGDKAMTLAGHVRTHLPQQESAAAATNKAESSTAPASLETGSGRQVTLKRNASSTSTDVSTPSAPQTHHLQPDGIHARSASRPSRGTIERQLTIDYKVYRTPFDPLRNEAHGIAANAARIFLAASNMCRVVLGEGDDADEEESDEEAEGSEEEGEGGAGGPKGGKGVKRVKLDFTDRQQQAKFGMPFVLPKNFQATVAAAVAAQAQAEDEAAAGEGDASMADAASIALGPGQGSTTLAAQSQVELRSEAQAALGELQAVEDQLLGWAGCNDILAKDLLETLDNVARTRRARVKGKGPTQRVGR
ncbi:hypothetical protein BDZ90DRAFT_280270 [Jaminaea rosea]|uniref:RFX-type winged-helix domain-containing protein n=1 Tax=Jaminaea rosea TaxID=1569628 RepID=A0A316UP90_9BASI|nr:hypothetical protein BDZ90DRAFT_280270 [Jaminaea rosea]PWN26784.1 hypothetical protein BDZ90DRAFT_280270 [Jaminaea rosea]